MPGSIFGQPFVKGNVIPRCVLGRLKMAYSKFGRNTLAILEGPMYTKHGMVNKNNSFTSRVY